MTTLVLLHSWGGSAREWDLVGPLLRAPSLALDLPGSGETPAISARQTVGEMTDAIIARLEGLEDYALVGHSMGGKVAQAIAARRPAGLKRLILVAPSPLSPEPMEESERARLLRSHGDRAEAERTADAVIQTDVSPELRERVIEDYLRTSAEGWRSWLEVGSREDLSALASEIRVPTLVIAGERDPVMARAMLDREVVGRISGATLEVVPESGHQIPVERPEALAALLNR